MATASTGQGLISAPVPATTQARVRRFLNLQDLPLRRLSVQF